MEDKEALPDFEKLISEDYASPRSSITDAQADIIYGMIEKLCSEKGSPITYLQLDQHIKRS